MNTSTTPPPNELGTETQVSADTPPFHRQTSSAGYGSGNLELSRTAVLHDLGPIPILPLASLAKMLPLLDESLDLLKVKEKLNIAGRRLPDWPKDPPGIDEVENTVFRRLETSAKTIIEACKAVNGSLSETASLIHNPTGTPFSKRTNTSQPDGYFLLSKTSRPDVTNERRPHEWLRYDLGTNKHPVYWQDIAVPTEYKKKATVADAADDERKIIWSMHHIMRADPCRRFTYGITVENTNMRVWLSHRGATTVFKGFNFITDHDSLIRVVASLTFATKEDLGWDLTIRPRVNQQTKNLDYEIDVHTSPSTSEVFIATKILSDFGADAMQGGGTRIFRVTNQKTREQGVLKDCWIDHDRPREGTVLDDLHRAMRNNNTFEEERLYFLTKQCHGDVRLHNALACDDTFNTIMRGTAIPENVKLLRVPLPDDVPEPKPNHSGSTGNIPDVISPPDAGTTTTHAPKAFYRRVHYRIVFTEEGQALHQVHDLERYFSALIRSTTALKILWRYGYVHRDVSTGNILLVGERAVLADLEYAKNFNPIPGTYAHDMRTGTFDFMAVEVANEGYLFQPRGRRKGEPVFRHNPLHDTESIWWLGVSGIFRHGMPRGATPRLEYNPRLQRTQAVQLFPKSIAWSRLAAFQGSTFAAMIPSVYPTCQPVLHVLEDMRGELLDRYAQVELTLVEAGASIDRGALDDLHDAILDRLSAARNVCPAGEMETLKEYIRATRDKE